MDRHRNASLSAREVGALHLLNLDPGQSISPGHRDLLLSMKLIELSAGQWILTVDGRRRLGEALSGNTMQTAG